MEKTHLCFVMVHTHTQIPFPPCLSPVRLPELRGVGWGWRGCVTDILEINLGVFAALGVEVQTARSDTK